jgi:hypothetical protein
MELEMATLRLWRWMLDKGLPGLLELFLEGLANS